MVSETKILTRLNSLETEIEELKLIVASSIKPKNPVSLRGMAKILLHESGKL